MNPLTLEMGETGRQALERLYRYAVDAGAIREMPKLEVV